MMKWEGAGADSSANATHFATGDKFDVFPMLVVGDSSFSTIGFQTDGKTVKFKIKHSKPGTPESYANDPYGETGFMSVKWYYGFLLERGERIALVKTSAPM
jgi:N4-gp56 family major capsid protein